MDLNVEQLLLLVSPGVLLITFWLGYYVGFRTSEKRNVVIANVAELGWWK